MTATVSVCTSSPRGGADDAGLLRGDLGEGLPQIIGVIQADRGDHRDRGVDDVGGVPAAAHPDLDDGDVDRCVCERGEGHRGQHLELAHRRAAGRFGLGVDHLNERLDLAVDLDVAGRADRFVVDGDALDHRLQMGAGGAAGALMERRQQCVDHAHHRRLAVGARDVDTRIAALW